MNETEKLTTAAIGRVAFIGDLYDARSNNFCGISMFKKPPPHDCIRSMDNGTTEVRFILTDTLEEKFKKLNVESELIISVIAGIFKLEGHAKCLNNEKKSKRAVRSSLLVNFQTKHERLDLFNDVLKDCLSFDAISLERATHVVTEISWGGNAMVTLEDSNSQDRALANIQANLQAELQQIVFSVEGKPPSFDYASDNSYNIKSFSIQIFADVLPSDEDLPQTIEEVLAFMKKMPSLLLNANDRKGKPLQYTMVPLSTVKNYLKISQMADQILHRVDEISVVRFVQFFDEISIIKQELNDLYNDMNNNKFCILLQDIKNVGQTKHDVDIMEANVREKLAKTLVAIRSGKQNAAELTTLLQFEHLPFSPNKIRDIINSYSSIIEKIQFAKLFKQDDVSYIGHGDSLDLVKAKNATGEIFVLFFGEKLKQSDGENWRGNMQLFLSLLREAKNESTTIEALRPNVKKYFIVVDITIRPDLAAEEGVKEGTRICHYKNGKYIDFDVLLTRATYDALCLAKSSQAMESVFSRPNKRVALQLQCPGACVFMDQEWVCSKCLELIDFGFDSYFYCSCGRAPCTTFRFKCSSEKHGLDFIAFVEKHLFDRLQKLTPFKEMNLLILGETGVGKSTFINALANYHTYSTLEEAEQNNLVDLIPTSFTILKDNTEECKIMTGTDKNEVDEPGQSSTQYPHAYTFESRGILIRIIDTPGIGDTRGYEYDIENTSNILKFISNLEELHGICILLKPNSARLNTLFRYCIKEILTHLHRNASQNIVFCFTNARSTFYRAGDTFPALKRLLSENSDLGIALSNHTMYYFDNESFRFLCITHYGKQFGITFNQDEHNTYSASWLKSVSEIDRMFEHISLLQPHTVKDTLSVNEARRIIFNLREPIADISKNIQDNIVLVQQKQEEIKISKLSEEALAKELYIPVINVERNNLMYPRMVCTSSGCVKQHTKEDGSLWTEYITICHDKCKLDGVRPEHYPNEKIKQCNMMSISLKGFRCKFCHCSYKKHTHLTYEQILVETQIANDSVSSNLNATRTASEKIEQFIESLQKRNEQLQYEQNVITKISAKFCFFLKSNSITPYNDALAEYLDSQIQEEKDRFQISGDGRRLERMEKNRKAYDEEVSNFHEAMKSGKQAEIVGPKEVKILVDELHSLEINGKQIRQHMEQAMQADSKMINYHETACKPKMKMRFQKVVSELSNIYEHMELAAYDKPNASEKSKPMPLLKWFGGFTTKFFGNKLK